MNKVVVRGVRYNVRVDGAGPPILMLHGFTGSMQSWDCLAKRLTPSFTTVRVDLLGHGESDAPSDYRRYAFDEVVEDLLLLMSRLDFGRFHLLGYSFGGRTACHLALAAPERIKSMVLASVSPGIEDPTERRARVDSDNDLASFIVREGIESFVDRWEQVPLFATERTLAPEVREARRRERLANRPVGLAGSLRGAGAGTQQYLIDRLKQLRVRTLIVAGELDSKYCALAGQMSGAMPQSRTEIVAGAGHAVHVEQPGAFFDAVFRFLQEPRSLSVT